MLFQRTTNARLSNVYTRIILIISTAGGITIRRVCLFVGVFASMFVNTVLGQNVSKTAGDTDAVTVEHP